MQCDGRRRLRCLRIRVLLGVVLRAGKFEGAATLDREDANNVGDRAMDQVGNQALPDGGIRKCAHVEQLMQELRSVLRSSVFSWMAKAPVLSSGQKGPPER